VVQQIIMANLDGYVGGAEVLQHAIGVAAAGAEQTTPSQDLKPIGLTAAGPSQNQTAFQEARCRTQGV
jgi:hypothetical protein